MKMAHVTVQTADLEGSVRFYQDIAGLRIIRDMRDRTENRIVFVGDADGDTLVELIENTDAFSGKGISLGFETDDVEGMREKLEREGYAPTPMRVVSGTTKFFFIKDPNGLNIQFINH